MSAYNISSYLSVFVINSDISVPVISKNIRFTNGVVFKLSNSHSAIFNTSRADKWVVYSDVTEAAYKLR